MTIVITAFERSPDGGKGLARDTRVRWALEEVAQRYEVRLVSFRAKKEPAHLRVHPFGLIPTYEEGGRRRSLSGGSGHDFASDPDAPNSSVASVSALPVGATAGGRTQSSNAWIAQEAAG
jgi:hypothetical protein